MGYNTHNFVDGQVLFAQPLNEMDAQIESNTEALDTKQDILSAGTNIKTINGESILGEGNLAVASLSPVVLGEGEYDPTTGIPTIENPDPKHLYFVPEADKDTSIEWVWLVTDEVGKWERIGSADVDLSGYATTEELATKQDTLVSGTNIKTVNSQSILGEGDVTIRTLDWDNIESVVEGYDYYLKNQVIDASHSPIRVSDIKIYTEDNAIRPFEFEFEFESLDGGEIQANNMGRTFFTIGGNSSGPQMSLHLVRNWGSSWAYMWLSDGNNNGEQYIAHVDDWPRIKKMYMKVIRDDNNHYQFNYIGTDDVKKNDVAFSFDGVSPITSFSNATIVLGATNSSAEEISFASQVTAKLNFFKFKWLDKE